MGGQASRIWKDLITLIKRKPNEKHFRGCGAELPVNRFFPKNKKTGKRFLSGSRCPVNFLFLPVA
jgi:hypothetical protein